MALAFSPSFVIVREYEGKVSLTHVDVYRLERVQEVAWRPWGLDYIPRRYCTGTVIVSVMKRVDVTTYNLIEAAMNGEFESGFVAAGMADGVSGLSWDDDSTVFADNGPADMIDALPAIQDELTDLKSQILDGSLEVCDALNDPSSDICADLGLTN